jgi:hypothetical protein
MGRISDTFWDTALFRRTVQRWAICASDAGQTKLSVLREQCTRARLLRAHLDRLIHTAEERLALPMVGSNGFPRPHNADWAWRPDLWRGPLGAPGMPVVAGKSTLSDGVTLFHDSNCAEITLRQLRNLRAEDIAPYGLLMDVFRFDGSFLSVVVDLPDAAIQGLKRTHILRVGSIIELERSLEIFVRLNIRHGPNTEQIVREMPVDTGDLTVEFDLAYADITEKRVEKVWIDIIFEGPDMNQVTLRDLTFCRRPRAQL